MKFQRGFIVGSAAALLAFAGMASASPELRDLGHGWQVLLPDADVIDIVVDDGASNSQQLVIEKFATFLSLDALDLVFTQTSAGAAPRIIITDEYINNMTGVTWNAFTNSLVDVTPGTSAAVFNQPLSANLSISPFTVASYNVASTSVTFSGGNIPDGGFWFPGVAQGALVVDVTSTPGVFSSFTLREAPTGVPTPGAAVLGTLACGVLAARRRR